MNYKKLEEDTYFFISSLVSYHLRANANYTTSKLAEKIGVSDSFLNKALSFNDNKHFNAEHLFLISDALIISPDNFFPSKDNYKLLNNKDLSDDEWDEIVEKLKHRKENNND